MNWIMPPEPLLDNLCTMNTGKHFLTLCMCLVILATGCNGAHTTERNEATKVPSISNPVSESDETLLFYLSKSELVVTGEIISHPDVIIKAKGISHYITTFQVDEVLCGSHPSEMQFNVDIVRPEANPGDAREYLKQGFRCILFLNSEPTGDIPHWQTSDDWFGIQFYNEMMVLKLDRLCPQQMTE
jgi:hypothetical protein